MRGNGEEGGREGGRGEMEGNWGETGEREEGWEGGRKGCGREGGRWGMGLKRSKGERAGGSDGMGDDENRRGDGALSYVA